MISNAEKTAREQQRDRDNMQDKKLRRLHRRLRRIEVDLALARQAFAKVKKFGGWALGFALAGGWGDDVMRLAKKLVEIVGGS